MPENPAASAHPSFLARICLSAVRGYQKYLSPLKMGSTCRFEPTCSSYALEAIRHHGALRGVFYTLVRLSKCGPWHPGGFDPVIAHSHTHQDADTNQGA